MPEGYPIQTNFTAGEVSPLIRGRIDINRYFNGCEKLQNMIVRPQGGVSHRMGSHFADEVKDSTKATILRKFEFSRTQAYILEFSPTKIRIFKDGALVKIAGTPVEVTTPYLEAHLPDLYFSQSADVMYITHPLYQTRTLSRTSDTVWTLATFTTEDGPYLDLDNRDYTMTLTNIVNRATLKSSAADFVSGDVNKYVEFPFKDKVLIGKIITFVDVNTVTIEPYENVIDTTLIDSRAVLEFQGGSGVLGQIVTGVPALVMTLPTGTTISPLNSPSTAGQTITLPVFSTMSIPGGSDAYITTGSATWPNRIRSSLAIWNSESENSYIKVNGIWYLTGNHYLQQESYDANPGGTTSADVLAVTSIPTMKATTGILSFSNHVITADLNSSDSVFSSTTDVGRQFRLEFSSEQVWGTITAYVSAIKVSVSLGRMMPPAKNRLDTYLDNAKTLTWRLGAFYVDNYPVCSTIHEERLVFAGTILQPQTVWLSKSADYPNFAPTDEQSKVLDDSAITYTISSNQINPIIWVMSSTVLLIGSFSGEWQTKASNIREPLTPTNIIVIEQTSYGSDTVRPTKVGSAILFIQRTGAKLRELVYDYQEDAYLAKDLTIISEHIYHKYGGAVSVAYQKDPNSILWTSTTDGTLVGMTYEKDQEVIAWHPHIIGGVFGSGQAIVEWVETIPSTDGKYDVLYMVVKRTINGSTKRYVEYLEKDFRPTSLTDKTGMFFVDSGLTYSGAAVSTLTGLTHLIGQTVKIIGDGTLRTDAVVNGSGEVTVSGTAVTLAYVGLYASAIVKPLPIESGSMSGTAQGKIKRVQRIILRLNDSMGFYFGPTEAKQYPQSATMYSATSLTSEDIVKDLEQNYGLTGQYVITQPEPLPLSILSLMPQMQTYL